MSACEAKKIESGGYCIRCSGGTPYKNAATNTCVATCPDGTFPNDTDNYC